MSKTIYCPEDRPKAGSPASRRDERRRAIIAAAEALFLEQGYDNTSLAEVVKRSGGSLATLYEMFGNKKGLLRAIAEQWRDEAQHCPFGEEEVAMPPSAALAHFARSKFEIMKSPRTVALARMIVTESFRDRDFAVGMYHGVHLPTIQKLADLFTAWNREGLANFPDPAAAARLFNAMIFADAHFKTLVGIDEGGIERQQLEWSIQLFCETFEVC